MLCYAMLLGDGGGERTKDFLNNIRQQLGIQIALQAWLLPA